MDAEKVTWDECAKLIVVCGAVTPNLTYHLLQYLINDGQLLCLCSDFLNSVLHTFTTAEVTNHIFTIMSCFFEFTCRCRS